MSAKIAAVLGAGRRLRTLGVDDSPFEVGQPEPVLTVGAVYSGDRFEGLLSCRVTQDGLDATDRLVEMIACSKFRAQLHLVLLDGICLGGFNVVDLPQLARGTGLPCAAVMRRPPDLAAMRAALSQLPAADRRERRLARAGPLHRGGELRFQVAGADPALVARALEICAVNGKLPECLRAAHLIGAGIVTGESGHRA